MDWLIPASELKLATMPRWSWSLATAIARGLWLQEVRIWQSHPGSPRLLLGAREIGRSWWCFDNEDIFSWSFFCKLYFELAQDIALHEEPTHSSERARVCASPRCKVLLLVAFSSEANSCWNFDFSWSFIVTSQIFSDLLRSSQIFSDLLRSSQIFSDLLSLSSLFKNSSEFWIEAELRVEYDGLAAANEVWSTLWSTRLPWPSCDILWPSLTFHFFGEAIRKELTATRSRTLALWVLGLMEWCFNFTISMS